MHLNRSVLTVDDYNSLNTYIRKQFRNTYFSWTYKKEFKSNTYVNKEIIILYDITGCDERELSEFKMHYNNIINNINN